MARIVYAGSPDFAVPALRSLLQSSHDVVAVLTQPDKPAGRGRRLTPCPVKTAAAQAGLRILQPEKLSESLVQAQLKALTADLMVVAAYGQLLPPEVLCIPRVGCVNLHASLLPRWRGASPIQTAILSGDAETGVSLMQMERGLDTGPVYATVSLSITAEDTGGTLHDKLAQLGAELLMQHMDALLAGTITAQPQPDDGACHAPRITKADGVINWQQSADDIDRRIRAFNPWPVAQTLLKGESLRCLMSSVPLLSREAGVAPEQTVTPGAVLGLAGDALRVQTGAGELLLHSLQLPGRKAVSGRAFANAHDLGGLVLGA
jgi:methionyl-tRNA formyltransferase